MSYDPTVYITRIELSGPLGVAHFDPRYLDSRAIVNESIRRIGSVTDARVIKVKTVAGYLGAWRDGEDCPWQIVKSRPLNAAERARIGPLS